LLLAASGCGKSANERASSVPIAKPAEAASQLQKAFESAPAAVQSKAAAASEALRGADYHRAAQSLASLGARKDLTAQQYMAVHESEMALIGRIVAAEQSGDRKPRADGQPQPKTRN